MMVIKLYTWKRRKGKTKWLKTKVYLIGAFCFATQDTKWVWVDLGYIAVLLRGVKLVVKCGYQSATRCSNSLHMHLDSLVSANTLEVANTCAQWWYTWWLALGSKGGEVGEEKEVLTGTGPWFCQDQTLRSKSGPDSALLAVAWLVLQTRRPSETRL